MTNIDHGKTLISCGTLSSKSMYMQTLQSSLGQSIHTQATRTVTRFSFLTWCKKQEQNHFMWVAFILAAQACVLIPVTLLSILVSGSNETALITLLSVTAMSFVSLLSAMSTKYTIPVFVVALVVDLALIAASWA